MTEDYKKNLMDLFCGRALDSDFDGINQENQLSSSEYDYSSILPANASNIGIYGVLEVPETLGNKSVLYGEYELDSEWYGLIILIDENQNPEECITEFDSGTKLRPIQKMIMDASGNVYAVDSTMPGIINFYNVLPDDDEKRETEYQNATLRFLMLNNFTLKTNNNYEVSLRRSYVINTEVDITARNFFCTNIFKNPTAAEFVFVGTEANQTAMIQAITLTINYGASNEWNLYKCNNQNLEDLNVFVGANAQWNNGGLDLICFGVNLYYQDLRKLTIGDTEYFDIEILGEQPNDASIMKQPFVMYKFFSNNFGYFMFSAIDNVYFWRYENGVATMFYQYQQPQNEDIQFYIVGNINNYRFIKIDWYETNVVGVYKNLTGNTFGFESEPFVTIQVPAGTALIDMFGEKTEKFNLNYYKIYLAAFSSVASAKYTIVKNLYDPNGYSGSFPRYDISSTYKDSLVPSQAISSHIQGEEKIVDFARNIYNIQIDGNITTSSVEIPYNYLNENNNQLALFSNTNLQMNNDYSMVKNRYEIVDANFVNAISIINNNDNAGIYNQVGASRLNNAVTNGADYTYYINKYLINYSDGTYKLNALEVVKDDDTHSHIMFSFLADKEINNIELVDNSTSVIDGVLQKGIVYQTIDGSSMQVGKLYAINQPVHIE